MKKILFVIESLGIGGAEKSLVSLLNTLDYSLYDVSLLLLYKEGSLLQYVPKTVTILPETDYYRFTKKSIVAQLTSFDLRFILCRIKTGLYIRSFFDRQLYSSQKHWKAVEYIFPRNEEEYDVAVAWGQGMPTYYVADKIKADRYIAVINADYSTLKLNRDYDRWYYNHYHKMVAVSETLNTSLKREFPGYSKKITTIYDIVQRDVIEKMSQAFNPYVKDKATTILATVGRLDKAKGYDLLVAAADYLKKQNISFTWFIVGEGSERSTIEKLIRDHFLNSEIILVGEQENPYPYIKNADIYVQTSKTEGFCLTLLEARILNSIIISTNFPTAIKQIRENETGIIVPMDGESIGRAICYVLKDEIIGHRLSSNLSLEKKDNQEEVEKWYQVFK